MQIITPYDIRLLTYDSTTRGYDGRLIVNRGYVFAKSLFDLWRPIVSLC